MMASTTMVHLKTKTGDGEHEANTMAAGEALPSGMKGGSYDSVASAANPLAAEEAYVRAAAAQPPAPPGSPLETPRRAAAPRCSPALRPCSRPALASSSSLAPSSAAC